MRRAAFVALCLSACGGESPLPTTNATAPGAGKAIKAPIAAAPSPAVATQPPRPTPPPLARSPVSRETPESQRPTPNYRAIGTEPFWAVTVRGDTLILERPGQPARRYRVALDDDGRALRYVGDGMTMTVTEGPCSDGMSDSIWSDRAQIAFADGALKGCGGERVDPDAAP